jgi:hypothetical protein
MTQTTTPKRQRSVLYTKDNLPVRKLRPSQAAEVYGVSVDYLAKLDPGVTGRTRKTRRLTTYDVANLERHFAPDEQGVAV